ncbi:class I SAM-dependent methyltransferase [Nocardia sputorum]|uniref:Methyltransferase n=1 Tax=Nocardia sputorum TaxID=2984338 RepID=A0ABN6TZ87_9NOCA|nr:class I SAM-dependent methyltransferase [Nocardia sputorum]BDT98085.1 methyltransferase [Nocardia sputorum]
MSATHHHADRTTPTTVEYWESFYQEREQVWSGRPNFLLVREIEAVAPGRALDLGCAEGADAIWLAERGWRVTAVDVSETALARARAHAERQELSGEIDWQRHDLDHTFPAGRFDLVSAQFLHSPLARDGERTRILRRAAEAVAPGGLLLIVGHAEWPTWVAEPPADVHFPTTAEVRADLALDPAEWRVEVEEVVEREHPGPEGQPGTRKDNILRIRRD